MARNSAEGRSRTMPNAQAPRKPIKIEEGDVLTSILKNANVQPPWIELRKGNRRGFEAGRRPEAAGGGDEAELEAINQKIRKYNRLVPNSLLQKRTIGRKR
ncbi:hypothetical protein [Paenibacillus sp. FSL M7-0831]|uniref:hypothetical protein n=1 Tax=Paenibacillus sp. FSL M7-0831 TaxID=2975314 RepID=UPI0030F6265A